MPDFDYTKPFQQKNGLFAELLCDGLNGGNCIAVKYRHEDGTLNAGTFRTDGYYFSKDNPTDRDLINIPEPQEEAMKLDFSRPFQTVSGKQPARLVCNDRKSLTGMTHLWLIASGDAEWSQSTNEHGVDQYGAQIIVNAPEVQTTWLYLLEDDGRRYLNRESTKHGQITGVKLLARKKVTITEGEFDE